MKKLVKTSFILLAFVSVLFTSCKKEYEIPPIYSVPFGDTLTISDILAMPAKTTFDTASVCGIVTADEQSGNLYKTIFIQDRATGKAIELRLNSSSAARIGDSVRVCLDPSLMYNPYHNLPQITDKNGNGFSPDGHLLIYPYNNPIEPKTVTIAEIMNGDYIGSLVRIENAEFRLKNAPFCETGETTNRVLDDSTYVNTTDDASQAKFIVRTSNYANFAYDYMPISKGSLVAIASIYNSTYQMIIRSKTEMNFAEWGAPVPVVPPGSVQSMPYEQSFASGFGTYMQYSVTGDQMWTIESNYSAAVMTGHIQSGDDHYYYENEDWLISSPVNIVGVSHAKMVMTYIGRYFDNINNDITIWASDNYVFGNDPSNATWTQISASLVTSSSWSDTKSAEMSLDEYIGKTITVAVKYISTNSKAGTMEVMGITVEEGEAGGVTPTPPTPGPGSGSGTQDDPYNVASGIALQGQDIVGWVQGYIVGAANAESSVSSNDDVDWAAPFTKATNVLIADDPNCHEVSQCVIVNLPAGKPLRTQVNLQDNPGNLGKLLAVNGKLRAYFGQAGLRDSGGTEADFVLEGGTPTPPPTPGDAIFSETFANGQGQFNIVDVNLSGLTYVWTYMNNFSCMKANGYYQGAHDAESWLVSPQIDMTSVSTATLRFEHALAFADGQGVCSVQVSTNYNGDVTTATWTELPIETWPEQSSSFPFVTTTASMNQFAGQTVTLAFRYNSTTGQCPAWEVKNVVVSE